MAAVLSQASQDAINKALASKDSAGQSDSDHAAAQAALAVASQDESNKAQASIAAHKVALDDAHTALADIAAEFGVPLTA